MMLWLAVVIVPLMSSGVEPVPRKLPATIVLLSLRPAEWKPPPAP